jgi:hypothetical protein
MSRIGGEQIVVAPKSNVYTVLAIVGLVVAILGLVVLITKAQEFMPPGITK